VRSDWRSSFDNGDWVFVPTDGDRLLQKILNYEGSNFSNVSSHPYASGSRLMNPVF
jgi:hypothetical protein